MTHLERLYAHIKGLQDLGLPLNDEMLREVDKLEERIIRKEILPALSKDIEPCLSQIQRDLVLVVEYRPGQPISVALSRKTNISEIIDAKRLEIDPQVEHREYGERGKQTGNRGPTTGLCVIRRDGSILQEKTAALTFAQAVKEAGLLKVRELGLKLAKVPIVSTTRDKKYGSRQIEMGPGLFVMTHCDNKEKKNRLERISKALRLGWKVEIYEKKIK